jgi:hypothetical protein
MWVCDFHTSYYSILSQSLDPRYACPRIKKDLASNKNMQDHVQGGGEISMQPQNDSSL